LVEEGESAQPSLSADGTKLVYVSGKRPLHNSPQVYVKDLRTGAERRVTFQNGIVSHPRFGPRGDQIVYSSTTDEDKEYPAFLRESGASGVLPTWLRQPTEVYVHGLNSFDIERVTTHAGYDSAAKFIRNGRSLSWTQVTRDRAAIISSNRTTHQTIELKGLDSNPTDFHLANDLTTAAWVSYDEMYAHARLMLRHAGKVTEVAADHATLKLDPSFSNDSRWLLWSEFDANTQTYTIHALDVVTKCAGAVAFEAAGSRRDPVLTPDGGTLIYTWLGFDKPRVARAKFMPKACP